MAEKIFEELNTSIRTLPEDLNLQDLQFTKLSDYVGQSLKVEGFFFNSKGMYGKQVTIIAKGSKINMPKWATEKFEKIAENEAMLKAMFEGHLMVADICERKTNKGITTSFTFKTI